MKRRTFLKIAGASIPALMWTPAPVFANPGNHRRVLLIELEGGNDSLNSFVPYADENYRRSRPRLALKTEDVVKLDDRIGLHPELRPLEATWDAGNLAIVEGLGYTQPNRSHFRSIEIWDTASDADDYLQEGWVARAWRGHNPPAKGVVPAAIVAGNADDGPLAAFDSLNLGNERQTFRWGKQMARVEARSANPALAHVMATQNDLVDSVGKLEAGLSKVPSLRGFPNGEFGKQLELAARVFASGLPVSVVKVTLDGFDTHVNQARRHARLMGQLAAGLAAFEKTARSVGFWDDVLLTTYSEFGRRVAENAGGGTDHGTAASHLVMGGGVKGGIYGRPCSLTDLDNGDLKFTTDYRRLYATVSKWWGNGPRFEGHAALNLLGV
jgi:uncharacterized protein (DUF1501 family)